MDKQETMHFFKWLESTVHRDDRSKVMRQIGQLIADHPDLIKKGRSWPEMRELAERNYPDRD